MEEEAAEKKFQKGKLLFDQGLINSFEELFDVIPYSVVARKIKLSNVRFKAKLTEPMGLRLKEIRDIAHLLDIDVIALFALVMKSEGKQN